jgi:hypothetical protein
LYEKVPTLSVMPEINIPEINILATKGLFCLNDRIQHHID